MHRNDERDGSSSCMEMRPSRQIVTSSNNAIKVKGIESNSKSNKSKVKCKGPGCFPMQPSTTAARVPYVGNKRISTAPIWEWEGEESKLNVYHRRH